MENPVDTIAQLRTMIDTYRTLLSEANERVAVNRAEGIALKVELDALKASKPKDDPAP